jgi:hypothetical protein
MFIFSFSSTILFIIFVDNAEERLVRKDEKIINLESEKQEHQGTENIPPVGRLCPPLSIKRHYVY